MAQYSETHDTVVGHGAGYGGFGGMGSGWLIGALIIFFLLFRDGFGHRGGHGEGGDGMRNRSWFPDIGNWEQEAHLDTKFCKLDQDIRSEGEKTRGLITENVIQDLRDKNTEKAAVIARLESEGFTTALFSKMMGEIGEIKCNMLKRPPVFGTASAPELIPVGVEARRGRCDWG